MGGENHLKSTGGGEGGETVAAKKLAGGNAHNRRSPLGTFSKNGVTHGLVDLARVANRDSLVQLLIDFLDKGGPVGFKIESRRGGE